MKKQQFYFELAVLLLLCTTVMQAQTGIDQARLMKKFIGTWRCETGKDTITIWDAKAFGTGFAVDYKNVAKGNTLMEGKQLFGYDKTMNKIIGANLVKGMDIEIAVLWFTSENNFEIIYQKDLVQPEKAAFKVKGEFKSPDVYTETVILNEKPVRSYVYNLMK